MQYTTITSDATVLVNEDPTFGFTVSCRKCFGKRIRFENTFGFSPESGAWGSVNLQCTDCQATTILVEGG